MEFQSTNHSWSPDGKKVVIQAVRGDMSTPVEIQHQLVVMDINTGNGFKLDEAKQWIALVCTARGN